MTGKIVNGQHLISVNVPFLLPSFVEEFVHMKTDVKCLCFEIAQ